MADFVFGGFCGFWFGVLLTIVVFEIVEWLEDRKDSAATSNPIPEGEG